MPKKNRKTKHINTRNMRVREQEPQEQPEAVENDYTIDSVIPPRLLKKLRRIPRLADLEKMFDEPSSSEDINNSLLIPNTPGDTQPAVATALQSPTPGPSSSVAIVDPQPSSLNNSPTVSPSQPTHSNTSNNFSQVVNTTNDSASNEDIIDLTADIDDGNMAKNIDRPIRNLKDNSEAYDISNMHLPKKICLIDNSNVTPDSGEQTVNSSTIKPRSIKSWRNTDMNRSEGSTGNSTNNNASDVNVSHSEGDQWGECPVCSNNLRFIEIASTLCGHVFCMRCIRAVVKSDNKTCPVCREPLNNESFHEIYL